MSTEFLPPISTTDRGRSRSPDSLGFEPGRGHQCNRGHRRARPGIPPVRPLASGSYLRLNSKPGCGLRSRQRFAPLAAAQGVAAMAESGGVGSTMLHEQFDALRRLLSSPCGATTSASALEGQKHFRSAWVARERNSRPGTMSRGPDFLFLEAGVAIEPA